MKNFIFVLIRYAFSGILMIHPAGLGVRFVPLWDGRVYILSNIRGNEQETKDGRDATIFHHYGIATRT